MQSPIAMIKFLLMLELLLDYDEYEYVDKEAELRKERKKIMTTLQQS